MNSDIVSLRNIDLSFLEDNGNLKFNYDVNANLLQRFPEYTHITKNLNIDLNPKDLILNLMDIYQPKTITKYTYIGGAYFDNNNWERYFFLPLGFYQLHITKNLLNNLINKLEPGVLDKIHKRHIERIGIVYKIPVLLPNMVFKIRNQHKTIDDNHLQMSVYSTDKACTSLCPWLLPNTYNGGQICQSNRISIKEHYQNLSENILKNDYDICSYYIDTYFQSYFNCDLLPETEKFFKGLDINRREFFTKCVLQDDNAYFEKIIYKFNYIHKLFPLSQKKKIKVHGINELNTLNNIIINNPKIKNISFRELKPISGIQLSNGIYLNLYDEFYINNKKFIALMIVCKYEILKFDKNVSKHDYILAYNCEEKSINYLNLKKCCKYIECKEIKIANINKQYDNKFITLTRKVDGNIFHVVTKLNHTACFNKKLYHLINDKYTYITSITKDKLEDCLNILKEDTIYNLFYTLHSIYIEYIKTPSTLKEKIRSNIYTNLYYCDEFSKIKNFKFKLFYKIDNFMCGAYHFIITDKEITLEEFVNNYLINIDMYGASNNNTIFINYTIDKIKYSIEIEQFNEYLEYVLSNYKSKKYMIINDNKLYTKNFDGSCNFDKIIHEKDFLRYKNGDESQLINFKVLSNIIRDWNIANEIYFTSELTGDFRFKLNSKLHLFMFKHEDLEEYYFKPMIVKNVFLNKIDIHSDSFNFGVNVDVYINDNEIKNVNVILYKFTPLTLIYFMGIIKKFGIYFIDYYNNSYIVLGHVLESKYIEFKSNSELNASKKLYKGIYQIKYVLSTDMSQIDPDDDLDMRFVLHNNIIVHVRFSDIKIHNTLPKGKKLVNKFLIDYNTDFLELRKSTKNKKCMVTMDTIYGSCLEILSKHIYYSTEYTSILDIIYM